MKESISIEDQLKSARRELAHREDVYPLMIEKAAGPRTISLPAMTQAAIDQEIERMRAIVETLERYGKLLPTLEQIYICANQDGDKCVHCNSIAKVMEDVIGFVKK